MLLEGLHLPLTTPFYPDGRLNLRKLEHNTARYSKTPVAGLVALSKTGEPTLLSGEETRQALRSVAISAAAEKVLLAGISRDSVAGTLHLAEYAAELGYDAVLVQQPSLLRGQSSHAVKELVTYFQIVADRSPLPIVLYSVASGEATGLPLEVVTELAGHPRIIGLADSDGSRARIEKLHAGTASITHNVTVTQVFAAVTNRMQPHNQNVATGFVSADMLTGAGAAVAVIASKPAVKTRAKVVGFQLLVAQTAAMLDGLMAGATGAMPSLAAAAPQACYEVLAAWKDADEGLAQEKQTRLNALAARIEEDFGVAGIKYGCDLNGYFGGWPRLPLLPLSGEERTEIEALMQGIRN